MSSKVVPCRTTQISHVKFDDLIARNLLLEKRCEELENLVKRQQKDPSRHENLEKGQVVGKKDSKIRVLMSNYEPQVIDTKDCLGARLLGEERWNQCRKFYHMMPNMMPYTFGVVALHSFGTVFETIMLTLFLNMKICAMLSQRFEVWFGFFNLIVALVSFSVIVETKFVMSIVVMHMELIPLLLTDALPDYSRKIMARTFFPFVILMTILIQAGIYFNWFTTKSHHFELLHIQISASGQAVTSLSTVAVFLTRYFIASRLHPEHMIILKAPISSFKQDRSTTCIQNAS